MRSEYRELLIQLRFLIRSGVPIREALSSLARRRRVSRLAGPLLEELERGESLGDAMAAHPRLFPPAHAALIGAGEQGGQLPEMVDTILAGAEAMGEARRMLLVQALYPLLVIVAALVLGPLLFYAATGRVVARWPLHLVVLLLLAALSAAAVMLWRGPDNLRRRLERFLLALPGLGSMIPLSILGRALRLEGLLLSAGLSFETSLPLVRRSVGWKLWAGEIDRAAEEIRGGRSASASLGRLTGLPEEIAGRMEAAETSGRLDIALRDAGEEMERRFLHRLNVSFRVLPILLYLIAALAVLDYAFGVLGGGGGSLP